jgi:hypothetical protein
VRQQPPDRRERFLDSQEGIVALGAQTCRQLLKAIAAAAAQPRGDGRGGGGAGGWARDGAMLPGFEFDAKGRLKPAWTRSARGRGAVRLKLSRVGVRTGMEHPAGVQ